MRGLCVGGDMVILPWNEPKNKMDHKMTPLKDGILKIIYKLAKEDGLFLVAFIVILSVMLLFVQAAILYTYCIFYDSQFCGFLLYLL